MGDIKKFGLLSDGQKPTNLLEDKKNWIKKYNKTNAQINNFSFYIYSGK